MLQVVKRAIGADRPKESPALAKARKAVEAARSHLESVRTAQAEHVSQARQAFASDPTDARADALAIAERRAQLQIGRAAELVTETEAALARLEAEAREARLAELDAIIASVGRDVAALEPRTREAIAALLEVARERDAVIQRAHAALRESAALRGADFERYVYPKSAGIDVTRGLLRQSIAARVDYDTRQLIASLFVSDGTSPLAPPPRAA